MATPANLSAAERRVRGDDLQLPLIESLSVLHVRSASRNAWHSHPMFELLLLREGSTAYEFAGGQSVEIPGGHFLVIPPGARHRGQYEVRRPAQLCGIGFDPRRRDAGVHSGLTRAELGWLAHQCERYSLAAWPMSGELRRLTSSLAKQVLELDRRRPAALAALRLTGCATLLEAARQLNVTRTVEPAETVRAAIAWMETHYSQPAPMAAVAKEAGCSRARLFALFKEATGMTPNDFLQRLRINRAQDALAKSNAPIIAIALGCGFSTSQYFSNVFRKYTGATPREFRQASRRAESGSRHAS